MKEIVALCMFMIVGGEFELKEHLYVPDGMGKCLQMKRESERNTNPERIKFMCGNVMAQMSEDGKHILAIAKKDD